VFVSRKQAVIRCEDGVYSITDLESKHGTTLNGKPLPPFVPAVLAASDRIAFAKGMVALAFSPIRLDETLDFTPMFPEEPFIPADVQLDPVRQTIRLNGTSYPFSEKEYRLLELLIRKERRFVSHDEIIRCVWPERADEGLAAPVGPEEINSLLYRIRKKKNYRMAIENVRGKGYILQNLTFK
jgi:two-component system response regulator QseB